MAKYKGIPLGRSTCYLLEDREVRQATDILAGILRAPHRLTEIAAKACGSLDAAYKRLQRRDPRPALRPLLPDGAPLVPTM